MKLNMNQAGMMIVWHPHPLAQLPLIYLEPAERAERAELAELAAVVDIVGIVLFGNVFSEFAFGLSLSGI